MEQKYMDMLMAINESIKQRQKNESSWGIKGIPLSQKTTGYRIYLRLEHDDFFERIDWLADNSYIVIGTEADNGGEWCDITDSYVETYTLTNLGKETVERKYSNDKEM